MFSAMMKTEFSTKKASPVKRRFPRGSTLLEQKAFCSAHSAVNAGCGRPTFFRPALQEAFIPALPGLFTCQTFSLRSVPGLLVLIIGFLFYSTTFYLEFPVFSSHTPTPIKFLHPPGLSAFLAAPWDLRLIGFPAEARFRL